MEMYACVNQWLKVYKIVCKCYAEDNITLSVAGYYFKLITISESKRVKAVIVWTEVVIVTTNAVTFKVTAMSSSN